MTGQELLYGLSFVDEKFIAEAETAHLGRNTPWMKWVSVAACLCILITGAYAVKLLQPKSMAETEAAAPAAPAPEYSNEEAAPLETIGPWDIGEPPTESVTESAAGELTHIPYARLRVVKLLSEGEFEAIAEATQDMEADTPVTVVVDPSKVPGADRQIMNDLSGLAEGMRLEIRDGAYDAGAEILYVAEVFLLP